MYRNAKDKGITLTSLVVTIVILLILSTIAYETGKGTVENARLSAYRAEMTIMQEEVDKLEQQFRQGNLSEAELSTLGKNISEAEGAEEALNEAGVTDTSGYKYFTAEALKSLGIENVENDYLINIQKRSVISLNGVKYHGEKYYTLADVPGGKYIVEKQDITSTVNFDVASDIQGNGMKIVVSNITYTGNVKKGSIYYGIEDASGNVTSWTRVKNETTDTSCTIDVLREGTYKVKVVPTTDNPENDATIKEVAVYQASYIIAETGTKYSTLAEAFNAAENGQTITQTRNCADSSEAAVDGKSITFNTNGKETTKKANTITVNSGATLTVVGNGSIKTTEGIVAITNNGTITIGDQTAPLSTSSPTIQGGTYGINTTGTFNFYNGSIKGTTEAFNTEPTATRENYDIITGTETINSTEYKTATLGISTITVNAPTNLAVSTAGIVTWDNSSNATGYQISIDGTNYTDATSGIDYLSTITETAGEKTIYVKAINSDTENYESTNASIATATVTVYTVNFESNDTSKGTVSPTSKNVIAGATYTVSGNTLTLEGITTGTTTTTLATVTATANNGCSLSSWSSTSGNIITTTTITALFTEANYSVDNTTITASLAEAIAAASDGSTIKLLRNYTDTEAADINKNVTLDLQTYTLTRDKTVTVSSGANVTITGNTGSKLTTETTDDNTLTNTGTLTIDGSITIEHNGTNTGFYAIWNCTAGATLNVKSGTITSTTTGITSAGKCTVIVNDGVISGKTGMELFQGSAYVNGGRIEGYNEGIYVRDGYEYPTYLYFGDSTATINTAVPMVIGGIYAIYKDPLFASCTFNNGILKGITAAYYGSITTRMGCFIESGTEEINDQTYQTAYLSPVYSVDDTTYAGTLAEAIAAASDGSTIKLHTNYTDTSIATIDKNVTLDLQTYTLTRDKTITVSSEANATITGGTGSKLTTGTTNVNTIDNQGTLTIDGNITIEHNETSKAGIDVGSNGILNVNGGTISGGIYGHTYEENVIINIGDSTKELRNSIPKIQGETYGVYGNSNAGVEFYFYNGIIKGKQGAYNDIREANIHARNGCTIVNDTETIDGTTYQTAYLAPIYSVDDTTYAGSLAEAIAAASDGSTIKLLLDYTDTSTATINKNVTLDLQTYTLTRDKTITISSGTDATITGSNGSKLTTGTTNVVTIENEGTLTIDGEVTIENNGTTTGYYAITNRVTLNILNGNIRSVYGAISQSASNCRINISGGTIQTTGTSGTRYGIKNNCYSNSGDEIEAQVNITGGTVIGGTYGVYNAGYIKPQVNITGGTVIGGTYGVYNYSSDANINIGSKTDLLNITSPIISGGTYGIYRRYGTVNFYNGILKGTTAGYYGTIASTRNGYGIATDTEVIDGTTYNTAYLERLIPNYLVDNTIETQTIADAITAASNGSTIKLIRDYTDTVAATINKNVTLDLQTYTLTRDKTITVSSGVEATITGSTGSKLTTGTADVNTINNLGTLTIDGSITIEHNGTNTSYYAINNIIEAILNVKSGTITSASYGIHNHRDMYANYTAVTNIGDCTATLSTTNPLISGQPYGVYNESAKWTYNNGTIQGTTSSFYDSSITANSGLEGGVRTDYIIVTGESGSYKTAHLEKMTDVTTPWLPTGASYTNTDLNTGVTMKDSYDNEWTWVVVPKTITAGASAIDVNEDPTGSNLETALVNYAATVVTDRGSYKDTWISEAKSGFTSDEYTSKKRNMLNGIKANGGFWIGKYEMGYLDTTTSSNYNSTSRTAVVQKDAYPYNYINLPNSAIKTEQLAMQAGGDGAMLFGTQWDLAIGYLVNRGGISKRSATYDSTNWGNYSYKVLTVEASTTKLGWPMEWKNDTYNWATFTGIKPNGTSKLLSTGAVEDVTNKLNIVDLAGNCREWTMESHNTASMVDRGRLLL